MIYWIVESALLRSRCWNRCFDNPRASGGGEKKEMIKVDFSEYGVAVSRIIVKKFEEGR